MSVTWFDNGHFMWQVPVFYSIWSMVYVKRQYVKSQETMRRGSSFHTKYFDSVYVCTMHRAFETNECIFVSFASGLFCWQRIQIATIDLQRVHFCGLCFTTYSGLAAHTSTVIALIIVPMRALRKRTNNVVHVIELRDWKRSVYGFLLKGIKNHSLKRLKKVLWGWGKYSTEYPDLNSWTICWFYFYTRYWLEFLILSKLSQENWNYDDVQICWIFSILQNNWPLDYDDIFMSSAICLLTTILSF